MDIADLVERQFATKNVDIVEFSESEDYCGKPLYPLQRVLLKLIFLEEMTGEEEDLLTWMINGGRGDMRLSSEIRERRDYCRERNYDHFTEVDLIGGRRGSKGHITALGVSKKIHDIFLLPDPGAYFNIDVDKEIYFVSLAASLKQAKERQFADFYSVLTRCRPLAQAIPSGKALEESISIRHEADERNIRRMKEMGLKVSKDFSKLRVQPLAANASTVRGLAMAACVFDEMAHMLPGESKSSAAECYGAIEPSLKQFRNQTLVFCNSSPWTKIGQFYQQALLSQAPSTSEAWYPMRFALQWSSWALYDFWWRDRRWSQAIMVSPDWPDQLDPEDDKSKLSESDLEARQMEQLTEKANPEKYRVEYRAQWAEVVDAYLDPLKVDAALSGFKPNGTPCKMTRAGGYQFDFKMHCDPSSTTAGFGFGIAHVEEFEDESGMWPDGMARHVVFDRVWRWNPEDFPEKTINYIKVREDLQKYIDVYRPSSLSFDQYNSVSLSQELREYCRRKNYGTRIDIDTATAKLNWDRWECFKTALNLGLVHMPKDCIDPKTGFDYSEWASFELKFLQEKPAGSVKRVDKQELGPCTTKDIADSICILTYKYLASYLGNLLDQSLDQKMRFGSSGGFQIGGRNPGGPMANENRGLAALEKFYKGSSNNPTRTRGLVRGKSRR